MHYGKYRNTRKRKVNKQGKEELTFTERLERNIKKLKRDLEEKV
jgi:hypothetical protein